MLFVLDCFYWLYDQSYYAVNLLCEHLSSSQTQIDMRIVGAVAWNTGIPRRAAGEFVCPRTAGPPSGRGPGAMAPA